MQASTVTQILLHTFLSFASVVPALVITRLNASPESMNSPAVSMIRSALSSSSDFPPPKCANEGTSFAQSAIEEHIKEFCDKETYWDTLIVPAVSIGTGLSDNGRRKALGVSDVWDLPGTSDKLHIGLMYTNESCTGTFQFTRGADDDEKRERCRARFRAVLNGCQTNTVSEKKGGSLRIVCAVYTITTAQAGVDPFDSSIWFRNRGDFRCEDAEVSGRKAGKCFYSGYPKVTDAFKLPSSGSCNDVSKVDLLVN